jgi:hypothetical protein
LRSAILVFGEDTNDTRSIAKLAKVLAPKIGSYEVSPRRDPVVHLRAADLPKTRRKTSETIARVVAAESIRRKVVAVIAHQDADAVEPAHVSIADVIEQELKSAGVPQPIAAVPAWELEAWLMLFPEAIRKTRGCWKRLDLKGRNTGTIGGAKEELRRLLRPTGQGRCPDYVESDSIKITENIEGLEGEKKAVLRRSSSFERFDTSLQNLKI